MECIKIKASRISIHTINDIKKNFRVYITARKTFSTACSCLAFGVQWLHIMHSHCASELALTNSKDSINPWVAACQLPALDQQFFLEVYVCIFIFGIKMCESSSGKKDGNIQDGQARC
jgi:hypothetical protein